MDTESILALSAGSYGVVVGLSPLLQANRAYRRRHSDDVSIHLFIIIFFGSLLWTLYGFSIDSLAIIAANIAGMLANIVTVSVVYYFRSWRKGVDEEAS
jgi:uncharacterized protein with PQ loop repeat